MNMNAAAMKSRHGARRRRAGNEQYFGNTVQLRLGWPRSVPMSAQQRKFNATKPALYRLDVPVMSDDLRAERHGMPLQQPVCITMTHRPYTPPAWQAKPLADGRVTLLVVPLTRLLKRGAISDFGPSDTAGYDWHFRDSWKRWHEVRHSRLLELLPYAPGDLIWCRETWAAWDGCPPAVFKATDDVDPYGGWKSPITMPKWAARTWLRCTGVEVRRVQTISEGEAWAVGCPKGDPTDNGGWFPKEELQPDGSEMGWDCPEDWVADKWDAQHTDKPRKRAGGTLPPKPAVDLSFDANPWAAFIAVEKISKEDV